MRFNDGQRKHHSRELQSLCGRTDLDAYHAHANQQGPKCEHAFKDCSA
jgi:hypothetical protein